VTPDCTIDVRFFAPPADLEGCFTTFYRVQLTVADGGIVEDWLQPEWANLRFFSGSRPIAHIAGKTLADARFTVTGPSALPNRFAIRSTRLWGIGLFPLGWARFVGLSAAEFANVLADGDRHPDFARFVPLADSLFAQSSDDEAEYARVVEFFRALDRPLPDQPRIETIHAALVDPNIDNVSDLAERSGLGVRSLERCCRRHFGFSPKLLLRRQRFMRSLAAFMLTKDGNWTEAIDQHYHDQSHFTRDFRMFMGMTPTEYAALPHPILSAFMAERARVWGSPAQTLDRPGHS
jgi:AraC-like DNA-binding protein